MQRKCEPKWNSIKWSWEVHIPQKHGDKDGGSDRDIAARIGKASAAFISLSPVWTSKLIGRRTKLSIFNANVKSVLLYGSENWRTIKATSRKIQIFVNKCFQTILQIYWPDTISNEDLWQTTGQEKMELQIKRRCWGWLGHTLCKLNTNTTKQALRWNPQGKQKRGRPRNS